MSSADQLPAHEGAPGGDVHDRALRVANLPLSGEVQGTRREQYLLDSAHPRAGDETRAWRARCPTTRRIVNRRSFNYKRIGDGAKPYWATNSGDGKRCFVSVSGNDRVSAITCRTGKEVARISVGDHPQRMRMVASTAHYVR